MPPFLQLDNVTVRRGPNTVFDGLSLEIDTGCSTAVLGPNGAGKSTLLKLLSRELYPVHGDDGGMRLFGRERWNVWELRTRLGLVSHDLQTEYPDHVTGRDVVLSGFHSSLGLWRNHEITDRDRERAAGVIDRLGLAGLQGRPYRTLSTGEQRRFLLARALVHDPEVLVLDEPMSGVDLKACFQYLDLVRGLIREGKTVVLATHHVHEIPPEVDRVVLLKGGRVVADGAKEEVLTGPRLSETFETPIEVARTNGFFQAVPGEG
ncbi:MAG: ABC transporter ATP-binding protein [Gemmatimonadota bacterium]